MASFMKRIVPIALAFIVCIALFLTIRILYSNRTQDVPPVRLPEVSSAFTEPCVQEEYQVTSIPLARYTMEAKRRGVNGTVRVGVYFDFDGIVSIAAASAKLPYGLTEEAIKAAKKIRFKPATACGRGLTEPAEIVYEFPSGQGRVVRL